MAAAQIRTPANRLSAAERATILEVCNVPEFANCPPSQIVPTLADHEGYIASGSELLARAPGA